MGLIKKITSFFMALFVAFGVIPLGAKCVEINETSQSDSININSRPKVSVIVPVYKVEPWIRQCMDSLVHQTLKEIEIIVVDDGSPDRCGEIADEYAKEYNNVRVIHQGNSGVQKARNAGIKVANGEYIALVDSDDYVHLNTYEVAYNLAKKDNLDIVEFGHRSFRDGRDNPPNKLDMSDGKVVTLEMFSRSAFSYAMWNKIYKAELIKTDNVQFVPGIRPYDDVCFFYMVLGRAKKIKKIPARFYNYRLRAGSLMAMTREQKFLNSYKMLKLICDDWRNHKLYKDNEHILLTILMKWLRRYETYAKKHAHEILNAFGRDILNAKSVAKCPPWARRCIHELEYAAKYNHA